MTLGGVFLLLATAGLAGALCSRGEPRPAGERPVQEAPGDSASDTVGDSGSDTVPPSRVPPESAVRRPPIMDPADRDRPPVELPRPDTSGA
jgi:hypothetical protein